ncbi:chitin deacetylase [Phlyctochytrium bullatum]|nr:chitin deacetylase [Phlyctochytrium bullatum]
MLKKIHEAGHQIALHTYSHANLSKISNEKIVSEVEWNLKAIEDVVGVRPRYIRPPFGEASNRVLKVLGAMGLQVVLWNMDTDDWGHPDNITDTLKAGIANLKSDGGTGGISLQHDLEEKWVSAGLGTVKMVKDAGYSLATIEKCVAGPSAYADGSSAGNGGGMDGGTDHGSDSITTASTTLSAYVATTTIGVATSSLPTSSSSSAPLSSSSSSSTYESPSTTYSAIPPFLPSTSQWKPTVNPTNLVILPTESAQVKSGGRKSRQGSLTRIISAFGSLLFMTAF